MKMTVSGVRSVWTVVALACASFASTAVPAQDQPLQGDAKHGKAISYTCLGCHGVEGYKNAYPMYSVPKLEGQHPEYLAGKPLVSKGKPEGTVPQAATLCVSCHGQDGVGIAPTYPSLAGQHSDY